MGASSRPKKKSARSSISVSAPPPRALISIQETRLRARLSQKISSLESDIHERIHQLEQFRLHDRAAYDEWYEWTFTEPLSQLKAFEFEIEKSTTTAQSEKKVKALYRELVRKLHPDSCDKIKGALREEWVELQTLYKKRDLQGLVIFCEKMQFCHSSIVAARGGKGADLMRVIEQKELSLQTLANELARAKKSPAWGFLKKSNLKTLQKKLAQELDERLREYRRSQEKQPDLFGDLPEANAEQISLF